MKEFKYKLELKDFIDFQLHYLKINSQIKSSTKKTIVILAVIYILLIAFMISFFKGENYLIIIPAILLSLLFSIIQIKTYKNRLEKKIIKKICQYAKAGKLDGVFGNKILTIYEDKLIFKEDRGEMIFNKPYIKKIDFSEKSIFIYTDDTSAIIVPKIYLSKEDIDFLLSYLT
ncbi:YcxB family protein [Brachyspira catarrhinii]|nr:YcxB family protein [Brachyspira catarrhinii]